MAQSWLGLPARVVRLGVGLEPREPLPRFPRDRTPVVIRRMVARRGTRPLQLCPSTIRLPSHAAARIQPAKTLRSRLPGPAHYDGLVFLCDAQ
jgi:hypothetical protein